MTKYDPLTKEQRTTNDDLVVDLELAYTDWSDHRTYDCKGIDGYGFICRECDEFATRIRNLLDNYYYSV